MIFLSVLLATVQLASGQQTCAGHFSQIAIDIAQNQTAKAASEAMALLRYSGFGIQQWGDYQACIRTNKAYFNFFFQSYYQPFGWCLPQECTLSQIQAAIPIVKDLISQAVHVDLSGVNIYVSSPEVLNPEPTSGMYWTMFLLLQIVLIALIKPITDGLRALKGQVSALVHQQKSGDDLLKIFSITENWKELIDCPTKDLNLAIFDGLRAIAFCMVVYGHEWFISLFSSSADTLPVVFPTWATLFTINCLYSVDMFFWIGGFFLGFVVIEPRTQNLIRKQGLIGIVLMIMHRVLRIWPALIVTILIVKYIVPYWGDGPRWYQSQAQLGCSDIWRNLLFIQVFGENNNRCIGWGWYLANDMMLFIASLAPLFLYIQFKQPFLGKLFIFALLVISQAIGTNMIFDKGLQLDYSNMVNQVDNGDYYMHPWSRGPPYFLGLLFGVMYRELKNYNQREKNDVYQSQEVSVPWMASLQRWLFRDSKIWRIQLFKWTMYTLGSAIIFTLYFAWRPLQTHGPTYWSKNFQSTWYSFQRLLMCFGLTLIALVGCVGIHDLFNTTIMGNYALKFISKISFCAYLIHYFIVVTSYTAFYETPSNTLFATLQFFIGNMVITLSLATLMTLIIEMPFGKLERMLTQPHKATRPKVAQDTNQKVDPIAVEEQNMSEPLLDHNRVKQLSIGSKPAEQSIKKDSNQSSVKDKKKRELSIQKELQA